MDDSNNESTKSPTEPPRKRRLPTYKTPPPSTCNGISIKYIHNSQRLNTLRKSHLILGFKHTIREGWTTRSRLEHPSHTSFVWPFHLPVVSALTDGNDVTKLVWVIEEHLPDCHTIFSNEVNNGSGSDFERFTIRHVECIRSSPSVLTTSGLCSACTKKKDALLRRFDSNAVLRQEEFNPNRRRCIGDRTMSLCNQRGDYYEKEGKKLARKLAYVLEKLKIGRCDRESGEVQQQQQQQHFEKGESSDEYYDPSDSEI